MAPIETSALGLATAAAAGGISFVSPCVLPLVPGYISYVTGAVDADTPAHSARLRLLAASSCFVLGFTTIFVLLGVSAQALGGLMQRHQDATNILGGLLIVIFGLVMTGWLRLPLLLADHRFHGAAYIRGPLGAYLLGITFAFGWTPCIGPILGAILTVTATSAGNGAVLLFAYGLGLGVPFLLTGLFFGSAVSFLKRLRRAGTALNLAAGGVMIVMGVMMMTGKLQDMAIWFLETFPAFGLIG